MKSSDNFQGTVEKFFPYLLLLAYIFVNLVLLLRHEPWRDEAHHWLLARDLSPLELIYEMRYDGHLCLWNLILSPFAKAGFPYITLNLISLSFMSLATAVFLFKAPFQIWTKAILIFSPLFTYYYPVISRQYCLIPPLVLLLALVYPQRHEKSLRYGLLIALLMQTHIIMLGMAAALSLLWLIEAIRIYQENGDKNKLAAQARGLCLPFLSLLFMILQLYAVPEFSTFFEVGKKIKDPLFPTFYKTLNECLSALFFFRSPYAYISLILIFVLVIIGIKKYHIHISTMLIILFSSLIFQLLIFSFVYEASVQRIITWGYIILFSLWIQAEQIKELSFKQTSAAILILISISFSFNFGQGILDDYSYPYSDSKNCASFINDYLPENALLVTNSDAIASSLIPYLSDKQMLNPSLLSAYSFLRWDNERLQFSTIEEINEWLKKDYPENEDFYLIYIEEWNSIISVEDMLKNTNLLYETEVKPIIENERYAIYKVPIS